MRSDDAVARLRRIVEPTDRHMSTLAPGGSAVLAPFVETPAGLALLFERRTGGPSRFAGHLSFPGGRIEPDDADPLSAALREAHEEIGFPPHAVDVLGHLVDTEDPLGRPVACYVGIVPLSAIPDAAASPDEVDEIILVPVTDLLVPGRASEADEWPPHAYRATQYESRALPDHERLVQYWNLTSVHDDSNATLWGFTGGLTALILHRAHDWQPPSAPRLVERWEDFLP